MPSLRHVHDCGLILSDLTAGTCEVRNVVTGARVGRDGLSVLQLRGRASLRVLPAFR